MIEARNSTRLLAWTTLALFALTLTVFVVPVSMFAMAAGNDGVSVGDGPTVVHAAGDETWGIYFNDADNTGYSGNCSVVDGTGRPVALRDPGVTVSSSDTEMLDHVFTTPSDGTFTIDCRASSATVRTGPVGNLQLLLIGVLAAGVLGLAGLVTGIVWLTRRSRAVAPSGA